MYPFMANQPKLFPEPLVGVVEDPILPNQKGWVKFQASLWRAKLYKTKQRALALKGETVSVIGREGLTLLIQLP